MPQHKCCRPILCDRGQCHRVPWKAIGIVGRGKHPQKGKARVKRPKITESNSEDTAQLEQELEVEVEVNEERSGQGEVEVGTSEKVPEEKEDAVVQEENIEEISPSSAEVQERSGQAEGEKEIEAVVQEMMEVEVQEKGVEANEERSGQGEVEVGTNEVEEDAKVQCSAVERKQAPAVQRPVPTVETSCQTQKLYGN